MFDIIIGNYFDHTQHLARQQGSDDNNTCDPSQHHYAHLATYFLSVTCAKPQHQNHEQQSSKGGKRRNDERDAWRQHQHRSSR